MVGSGFENMILDFSFPEKHDFVKMNSLVSNMLRVDSVEMAVQS